MNRAPRFKYDRHSVCLFLYRDRQECLPNCLSCKRGTAAAAASRVWISEREARSHDAHHVVDFHAVQILRAEHVDKKFDATLVENKIALPRIFFDVQAVLET